MAEKSSWDQVNIRQNQVWFGERKLAKLSSRLLLLAVLPLNYFTVWSFKPSPTHSKHSQSGYLPVFMFIFFTVYEADNNSSAKKPEPLFVNVYGAQESIPGLLKFTNTVSKLSFVFLSLSYVFKCVQCLSFIYISINDSRHPSVSTAGATHLLYSISKFTNFEHATRSTHAEKVSKITGGFYLYLLIYSSPKGMCKAQEVHQGAISQQY